MLSHYFHRTVKANFDSEALPYEETTCSTDSFHRGQGPML